MQRCVGWAALMGVLACGAAEPAVVVLPELAVQGEAVGTEGTGGVGSRVELPPMVLLLPQGSGAQADLSVRGSSFSETGYSLAGLSLRNPQTEHFNAELPLPPEVLGAPAVLTGMDQALGASGHLAGTVGLAFAPVERGTAAALWGGEAGAYGGRAWRGQPLTPDGSWRGAAFAGQQWLPGLDYGHNEAESVNGGLHLQQRRGEQAIDAVAAMQERDFGARGFYGASPARHASETTQDGLLLGSWRLGLRRLGDFVRVTGSARRFADDYMLDDRDADYYRNEHCTLTSSGGADGRLSVGDGAALNWRVWAEDERIDSQGVFRGARTPGLGDHDRQRLGGMLLPELVLGGLVLRGGGQVVVFSEDSPAPLFLGGLEYAVGSGHVGYGTVTQQVRQPSFTELDYESPTSLGNAGLENETSTELEAGLRSQWSPRWESRLAGFRRQTAHTVDWVRPAAGTRWLATDLGRVTTTGAEAEATFRAGRGLALSGLAQGLTKAGDLDGEASRYVYNYPEARLSVAATWSPWPWVEVSTRQTALVYARNPARRSDRWGTDSALEVRLRPPRWEAVTVAVAVTNLFDDGTEVYPGQKRSGQGVMARLSARW